MEEVRFKWSFKTRQRQKEAGIQRQWIPKLEPGVERIVHWHFSGWYVEQLEVSVRKNEGVWRVTTSTHGRRGKVVEWRQSTGMRVASWKKMRPATGSQRSFFRRCDMDGRYMFLFWFPEDLSGSTALYILHCSVYSIFCTALYILHCTALYILQSGYLFRGNANKEWTAVVSPRE